MRRRFAGTDVCIVSSCGGHLTEVRCLMDAYRHLPHLYVLNDRAMLPDDMLGRTLFITHAERDWRVLLNVWEAFKILRSVRPKVLLSTGAGPIVPFALLARSLFGIPVIYVETLTRVARPSLTGRIMYRLTDEFYFQHEPLRRWFPKGICLGLVT